MAATAAAAADPSSPSPCPRASHAPRHSWTLVNGAEPEGPAANVPPSPSSPPPAVAIADLEISDRSPQEVHAGDAFGDAAQGKKQAWKRAHNVSAKAGGVVMGGAASWPALSETAKPCPKSSSSDTLKSLSEALHSAPAGTTISTSSTKPNSNPSLSGNQTTPARQKSMKRGGGSNISSSGAAGDGGMTLPSPPPNSSPMAISEKHTPSEISFSLRDQISRKNTNWDRGNTLGRSVLHADDGSDLRSYGGYRRWNNGGTDVRMQPRNARLLRPPTSPGAPPFLGPPPRVGPFGNPMVFPDVPSPIFYIATQPPPVGVPFVPHPAVPPQMFIPTIDPQRANLLKQIDYYFSAENLCRDVYLRQNMDEQGWVPVSLIAGFNRVKQLTKSVDFILETAINDCGSAG